MNEKFTLKRQLKRNGGSIFFVFWYENTKIKGKLFKWIAIVWSLEVIHFIWIILEDGWYLNS